MESSPALIDGSRLCITVRKNGVTSYGNAAALRTLAQWLLWIASSDPKDHFECHVRMDLEDQASKFDGKQPPNVFVVFEDQIGPRPDFEMTFMAAPEHELDAMVSSRPKP